MSAACLRKKSIAQREHRPFAQGEKGRCTVRGEVLTDVQMDAQSVSEQRRAFVCLLQDLIGHLFLIEGIATLDNGCPREVIAIGKQICIISIQSASIHIDKKEDPTQIRPCRLDVGVIVSWKRIGTAEVQIQHSRALLQGSINRLDRCSESRML